MFGDPRQLPSSVLADQSARGSGAPHLTSVSGGTQGPSVPPGASALPGEMRAVRAQGRHCGTDNISLQFLLKFFFCILNSHEAIDAAFHTYSPSQSQATPKLTAGRLLVQYWQCPAGAGLALLGLRAADGDLMETLPLRKGFADFLDHDPQ